MFAAGWLGWPDKVDEFLTVVTRMGPAASKLRGFATNGASPRIGLLGSDGMPSPSNL